MIKKKDIVECGECHQEAEYICPDCSSLYCEEHAEGGDAECAYCQPPRLMEIDKKLRKELWLKT